MPRAPQRARHPDVVLPWNRRFLAPPQVVRPTRQVMRNASQEAISRGVLNLRTLRHAGGTGGQDQPSATPHQPRPGHRAGTYKERTVSSRTAKTPPKNCGPDRQSPRATRSR